MVTRIGHALQCSQVPYIIGNIIFFLTVTNQFHAEPLVLNYPTSQEYDFWLTDPNGTETWRWSTNQVFDPTPISVQIPPNAVRVHSQELQSLPNVAAGTAFVTLHGASVADNFATYSTLRIDIVR